MSEPRDRKSALPRSAPREAGRGSDDPPARVCELCGGTALERHCRVICLNCGFQRDCSDP